MVFLVSLSEHEDGHLGVSKDNWKFWEAKMVEDGLFSESASGPDHLLVAPGMDGLELACLVLAPGPARCCLEEDNSSCIGLEEVTGEINRQTSLF